MANYTFTVNSTYNPFDVLNSAIARGDAMTKDMNDYQDAYAAIATQAATLQQRAEMEQDSKWAQRYNDYRSKLNDSADLLLRQGLSPATRSLVNDAKTMYASDIVPIQEAVTRQNEEIARRLKAKPEERMQYGRLASIDDYIADPNYMNTLYSGSQIEKDAMEQAAALAKREIRDKWGKATDLGNYWMQHLKETGFSNVEMEKLFREINELPGQTEFVNNPAGYLKYIYDNVRDKYGYREDMTLEPEQREKLDREIFSGIFKGLTHSVDNTMQVDSPRLTMEQERAARARTARGYTLNTTGYDIRPINLYGVGEKTDMEEFLESAKEDFGSDKNGNFIMNQSAKDILRKELGLDDRVRPYQTPLYRITGKPDKFAKFSTKMKDWSGNYLQYYPVVAMRILENYKDKGYLTDEQFKKFQARIDNGYYRDKVVDGGSKDEFMNDLIADTEATINSKRVELDFYNAYHGTGDIWGTNGISLPITADEESIVELLTHNAPNGKLTIGGRYRSTTGKRDEDDDIKVSDLVDSNNKLKGKIQDVEVTLDATGEPVMYLNLQQGGKVQHIKLDYLKDAYKDQEFKKAAKLVFKHPKTLKKLLFDMKMRGASNEEIMMARQNFIDMAEQNLDYKQAQQNMIHNFVSSLGRFKPGSTTVQSNEY